MKTLTRTEFREGVFARDNHKCVICGDLAVDAHHIIERRLWNDGGYHLDNGASVCALHHMGAEQTLISCEELREAAGITKVILPDHLYDGEVYTKWGDVINSDGTRSPGELFWDESVQKVLEIGAVLDQYRTHVKHPRTMHLPWSESLTKDDRTISTLKYLEEADSIVVSEKLDGEQTTMYCDHIHARSVDSRNHPSRDWVKNLWSGLAHDIPAGFRVCGESMYAVHSIRYEELSTFFYVHSIWNEHNTCLSWDETKEWCALLGLEHVPEIRIVPGRRVSDHAGHFEGKERATCEGYVIRDAEAFPLSEFQYRVGKFVRQGHVQTTKHWMHGQAIERNGLRNESSS